MIEPSCGMLCNLKSCSVKPEIQLVIVPLMHLDLAWAVECVTGVDLNRCAADATRFKQACRLYK